MKLLLHTCCAPCMIYPLGQLRAKGYAVTGYFYNPNIHPLEEYRNRRLAVEEISESLGCPVIYPSYVPAEYFQAVGQKNVPMAERCKLCWSLRLKATAEMAKEEGFANFCTTLLVSPYQDQELLKQCGASAAEAAGVSFYAEDFRPGFRQAHSQAKALGLYCQKYCGCIYSQEERCQKLERR